MPHEQVLRRATERLFPAGLLDLRLCARLDVSRRLAGREFADRETVTGRPGVWHPSRSEYDPVATAGGLEAPVSVAVTDGADEAAQPERVPSEGRSDTWREGVPDGSSAGRHAGLDHFPRSVTPPAGAVPPTGAASRR